MINKQKFKGSTLYRKRVTDNILKVYHDNRLNINNDWYNEANNFARRLARKYGYDVVTVAGVIAALSPLKSWNENKRIAELFLSQGIGKHTQKMIDKAISIRDYKKSDKVDHCLRVLNGNKIQSFFLNIVKPDMDNIVTVDRHAISIGLGRNMTQQEGIGITDGQYAFFTSCYIDCANKVGVRANMMQSITWEKWRQLKKEI